MRARLALATVLCASVLSGAGLLGVGYLADDWIIVRHVSVHGNAGAWTGSWLGLETPRFHKPLGTGLYHLEYLLFGPSPVAAHVHALLWHVLAVGVLFALLRDLGTARRGALLGALLFALHPFHPMTVGWIAGRGGMVPAVLTLLCAWAYLRHRLRGGRAWLGLAVVAAVAAAMTKESGYLAFLVPPTVDLVWTRPRSLTRAARGALPFVLAGAGAVALRRVALGRFVGGYGLPEGVLLGGGRGWEYLEGFAGACGRAAGGVPPVYVDGGVLPAVAGGVLVAASAAGVLMVSGSGRPGGGRAAALLAALLVWQLLLILLAAGAHQPAIDAQRWYGALAFGVGLLGVAAGRLRSAWLVAPLLLLVLWAAGNVAGQRFMQEVGRFSDRLLRAVRDATSELPAATDAVFVSGLPASWHGVPVFWVGLDAAQRPPFQPRRDVPPFYPVHDYLELGARAPWPGHPPVEPLLAARGRRPVLLQVETRAEEGRLALAGVKTVDVAAAAPPAQLRALVAERFAGRPPALRAPPEPVVRLDASSFDVPLELEAPGMDRLDVFVFLPGKDQRIRLPVTEGKVRFDGLGGFVRDPLVFRGVAADVFVLPVGFSDGDGTLHLGPLLELRYRPDPP